MRDEIHSDPGELTTKDLAEPGTSDDATAGTGTGTDTGTDTDTGIGTGTGTGIGDSADHPAYPGEATPEDSGLPGAGSTVGGEAPADEGAAADEGTQGGNASVAETSTPAEEEPLMPESEAADFRDQWTRIQGGFVDDPQEAVRAADALVAAVMQHLAGTFSSHKESLEQQWHSGGEAATEDLRLALQRYRSFFNRLLST
ncbi:hypothetical protein AB0953_05425 [Streptomyces sp. NPDC046866]|uniref:hypothetical protein n=1 Tax=Streptomyces sp. NPDC046866 TaxID=3154921 RepID=UPI003456E9DC